MADTQLVTLVGSAEQTVNLTFDSGRVQITHDGVATDPVYARFDGTPAAIAASGCHLIPPGATRSFDRKSETDSETPPVSLISAGAPVVEVEGI